MFIFEEKIYKEKKLYTLTTNDKEFINTMKSIEIKGFDIIPEFPKFMKEMVPEKPFDSYLDT